MPLTVAPNLDAVYLKVLAYVTGIVPVGTPLLRGPLNRVAQPAVPHGILTPIYRARLRTGVERDVDPFPLPGSRIETETGVRIDFQMDFYGEPAGDWAGMVSDMWRTEYACRALAPTCAPLYADEGRMVPLVTGEEQYLERWTVTGVLQYNPVTSTPQEFADALNANLINVDVSYPP